jgi:hypothetical protein
MIRKRPPVTGKLAMELRRMKRYCLGYEGNNKKTTRFFSTSTSEFLFPFFSFCFLYLLRNITKTKVGNPK